MPMVFVEQREEGGTKGSENEFYCGNDHCQQQQQTIFTAVL